MPYRIAVDVGGTFTDLVAVDEDARQVVEAKVLTTPHDPAAGIVAVLDRSAVPSHDMTHFLHGTTLVINALTERHGARTALITTYGFGDLLEIQRCNRPDMYNLRYVKPRPFVPRDRVFEVRERVTKDGAVLAPLDEDDLGAAARGCREAGAEAVAVCLLHAYANPAHELRCRAVLAELLPGCPVTLSHELTREWREYERCTTAVLNAYVQPAASAYLDRLDGVLESRRAASRRHVMQSNGRVMTFRGAARAPIQIVESGPAGGVLGAIAVGRALGIANLISLDVGGTTAKASLVRDGAAALQTEYYIERDRIHAGYPLKVPTVDIVEVGAGGGSIAGLRGGRLSVGPQSAGADPGPACYGRGGTEPTVTDAFLLTGALNPAYFLGGELSLDAGAARDAYARLAERLGVGVDEAVLGVIRLANANMVNTLRLVSVHRGHDPRDFALLAMGGGGPMHACELARDLGTRRVVIPPRSGVFSAYGMLNADLGIDLIRTRILRLDAPAARTLLDETFTEMAADAERTLAASGAGALHPVLSRALDMRYEGQEHTVDVPVPENADVETIAARFHEAHERRYTFRLTSRIEVVNFRLAAIVPLPRPALPEAPPARGTPRPAATRPVRFVSGLRDTPVFRRETLGAGAELTGPAIVEEASTTTVLLPGDRLAVHPTGSLVIAVGELYA